MAVHTAYGEQKTTKLECISKRAIHRKDTVFNNIGYVVDLDLLRECYQEKIHENIYELKKNFGYAKIIRHIEYLLEKYQVDSWIVGCTEFHLISNFLLIKQHSLNQELYHDMQNIKNIEKYQNLKTFSTIIDPLLMVTQDINQGLYMEKKYAKKELAQCFPEKHK